MYEVGGGSSTSSPLRLKCSVLIPHTTHLLPSNLLTKLTTDIPTSAGGVESSLEIETTSVSFLAPSNVCNQWVMWRVTTLTIWGSSHPLLWKPADIVPRSKYIPPTCVIPPGKVLHGHRLRPVPPTPPSTDTNEIETIVTVRPVN